MKLLVFAASHRAESLNRKLVCLAAEHLSSQGITVDFAEYKEFDMPLYNDDVAIRDGVPSIAKSFAKRAENADGIVISSPEYNWSLPGSLKNIIDWTSRISPNPLAKKPAFLMCATTSSRGGIVGLSHLKVSLEAQDMFVFPRMYTLGNAVESLAEGKFASDKQQKLFISMTNEYLAFARTLTNR